MHVESRMQGKVEINNYIYIGNVSPFTPQCEKTWSSGAVVDQVAWFPISTSDKSKMLSAFLWLLTLTQGE